MCVIIPYDDWRRMTGTSFPPPVGVQKKTDINRNKTCGLPLGMYFIIGDVNF